MGGCACVGACEWVHACAWVGGCVRGCVYARVCARVCACFFLLLASCPLLRKGERGIERWEALGALREEWRPSGARKEEKSSRGRANGLRLWGRRDPRKPSPISSPRPTRKKRTNRSHTEEKRAKEEREREGNGKGKERKGRARAGREQEGRKRERSLQKGSSGDWRDATLALVPPANDPPFSCDEDDSATPSDPASPAVPP